MIDPDTPDSVQADAPSGQDPATPEYRERTATASDSANTSGIRSTNGTSGTAGTAGTAGTPDGHESVRDAAPDPREVKSAGDDSSAAKDPEAWVTGDEPMTGPQASYLATLAQQAGEAPPERLTKAEASEAIDQLRQRAGR